MSLFGKKETKKVEEKTETSKDDFPEATEAIFSPTEDGKHKASESHIRGCLLNKVIEKGETVILKDETFNKKFDKVFDNFNMSEGQRESWKIPDVKVFVIDTNPSGKVKITKWTDIKSMTGFPDSEGFPITQLIIVNEIPSLNKMNEVKDKEQIEKIINVGGFVSKYEDKKQIIYFTHEWFYRKKK
jgi:hypothetical protein